jgi:hypothetical protein
MKNDNTLDLTPPHVILLDGHRPRHVNTDQMPPSIICSTIRYDDTLTTRQLSFDRSITIDNSPHVLALQEEKLASDSTYIQHRDNHYILTVMSLSDNPDAPHQSVRLSHKMLLKLYKVLAEQTEQDPAIARTFKEDRMTHGATAFAMRIEHHLNEGMTLKESVRDIIQSLDSTTQQPNQRTR